MFKLYKKFFSSLKMQVKRRYLMLWKRETIEKEISKRRGECLGCGECCKASFSCPFLFEYQGKLLCKIHETKPEVCKTYPFSKEDMFPHAKEKCGYYFVKNNDREPKKKKR
ncbi:MAG: YkgJ family cysteine cluster protein [Candidatus Riflebacteria bacterium]|nr:YkgJ family cysteine cluster protein [Candidatus Riflebacteria bacterium]